ncbi:hypothetical protein IHE44_0001092 [Lamprotornis superbus]|uniref:Tumor protein D52 n=1 Tax=Lamprotornis superbus TaxID=245042 RepID=A0A835TVQ0_9PASS|nr:hypothetical protein IHE44_0001092 [Lamprotornis superbus]
MLEVLNTAAFAYQLLLCEPDVSIVPGELGDKGRLLRSDSIPEVGEDAAATVSMAETLSEEERDELRKELAKVEEEIQTLSQVLAAKEKHLAEIKRKLGINSLQELKQNITKSWQDVTSTTANSPTFKSFEEKVENFKLSVACKGHWTGRPDKEKGSPPAKERTSVSAGFTQVMAGSHMSRNVLSYERVPHTTSHMAVLLS